MQKGVVEEQQLWMKNMRNLEKYPSQKTLEGLGKGRNQIVDGGILDRMVLNV